MSNAYASVDVIKGSSVLNVGTGTVHDTRLRLLSEAVSREVDRYINRSIYARTDTLFFSGGGGTFLEVPDLVSVGTLSEDNNMDGTFEVDWGAADFILYPYNAKPTSTDGNPTPHYAIQVNPASTGTQDVFQRDTRNYRIIGTWGYSSVTIAAGVNASASWDSTATTLTLSGTASGTIEAGVTVLIDSEQIYVTNRTGTSITVQRGMNGSTAGTHASGSAVRVFQYPPAIREAVIMQAGRIFKRAQSGFANESGSPEGIITVFRGGLDGDVKALLAPFRKYAI